MRALWALLVPLLLIAGSTSAGAESWSGADERRDVVEYERSLRPRPCGIVTRTPRPDNEKDDITRLGVSHTERWIGLAVRYRDLLVTRRVQALSVTLQGPDDRSWLLLASWRRRSSGDVRMSTTLVRLADVRPGRCGVRFFIDEVTRCDDRSTLASKVDRVSIVLPRSCLDSPAWVRVSAGSSSLKAVVDDETFVHFWDRWTDAEGVGRSPRVHAHA